MNEGWESSQIDRMHRAETKAVDAKRPFVVGFRMNAMEFLMKWILH